MSNLRRRQSGNALIEFTLVGIPMIFVLISTFEISRGMWLYHTLAHALRVGTRFAIVHGQDCSNTYNYPSNCLVQISDIATQISNAGVGLLPEQLQQMTFTAGSYTYTGCSTLQACLSDTTTFPPDDGVNDIAGIDVTIRAQYPFSSAIVMFWPGSSTVGVFPTFNLWGTSTERIEF
jgi:Flp pilus assembly protein TadG